MTWICATCNGSAYDDNISRIQHFINEHSFRPKHSDNSFGFFYNEVSITSRCPICNQEAKLLVSHTFKSIKIQCLNQDCNTILFYRQVLETKPVSQDNMIIKGVIQ